MPLTRYILRLVVPKRVRAMAIFDGDRAMAGIEEVLAEARRWIDESNELEAARLRTMSNDERKS